MDEAMVVRAQLDQVVERRGTTTRPVMDVVSASQAVHVDMHIDLARVTIRAAGGVRQ
jgi:hypothetical protein